MALTLITGTPGAGKTLLAVSQEAQPVPGSTVEASASCVSHGVTYRAGDAVPRHLFSNVRGLLVEHTTIDGPDLERWHEWAQPGDVILFDEVQDVWRTRGLGAKVPDAIAALEMHRHRGVDLVLVTQHPMLMDANIRRLVNRHLHVRRIASVVSMIYEWDHCAQPGQVKTALSSRVWWFPRKAFRLYNSAQLHTKAKARLPPVAFVGLAAVVGLAIGGPMVYERLSSRFKVEGSASEGTVVSRTVSTVPTSGPVASAASAAAPAASAPAVPASGGGLPGGPAVVEAAGCGVARGVCRCYGPRGELVERVPGTCEALERADAALSLEVLPGGVSSGVVGDGAGDGAVLASMRDGQWWRR